MEGAERFKKISLGKLKSPPDLDQNAPRFPSNFFYLFPQFRLCRERSWVLTVVDSVGEDGLCVNFLVDIDQKCHHLHLVIRTAGVDICFGAGQFYVRFFYLTSTVETRSSTFSSTEWHVCLICVNNFVDEKQDKLKCGLIWNTCVLWFPMDTCGYSSAGHNLQVNGDFYLTAS